MECKMAPDRLQTIWLEGYYDEWSDVGGMFHVNMMNVRDEREGKELRRNVEGSTHH